MSYLVLARKWRPQVFEDVLGQEHVTKTLENAIKSERLANAYLFSGPRGVGKTTIARVLAKAINCETGRTTIPCNKCHSCIEIAESRSLDVFEIDGASNRGIDEVRNLRENLRYAPNKGKYKIYIIDEVHMLTVEAFNALLKTLEEPPKNVLFIFATTEPHKVPATISSRCQRFTFKRLPIKKIIEQLQIICHAENIQIDAEALQCIARKADGSMRDSQSILDQALSYAGHRIEYHQLLELLGIIDNEFFFELTDYIRNKDTKGLLALVERIFMEGYDVGEFLVSAVEHFRNLLVAKVTQKMATLDVSENVAKRYMKDSADFSEEDILRYIKIATDTEYAIKRSSNPRLKFEFALLKMVKMESTVSLGQLLEKLEALQQNTIVNFAPKMQAGSLLQDSQAALAVAPPLLTIEKRKSEILNLLSKKNPESRDELKTENIVADVNEAHFISIDRVKENWIKIIEQIKTKHVALSVFINEGVPTSISENILELTFPKENDFHINTVSKNRVIIEKIITQVIGLSVRLKCVKGDVIKVTTVSPSPELPGESEKMPEIAVVKSGNNQAVLDEILEIFDGEYMS
jgi:DNA polymerase-3 subunit gamma/tau